MLYSSWDRFFFVWAKYPVLMHFLYYWWLYLAGTENGLLSNTKNLLRTFLDNSVFTNSVQINCLFTVNNSLIPGLWKWTQQCAKQIFTIERFKGLLSLLRISRHVFPGVSRVPIFRWARTLFNSSLVILLILSLSFWMELVIILIATVCFSMSDLISSIMLFYDVFCVELSSVTYLF